MLFPLLFVFLGTDANLRWLHYCLSTCKAIGFPQ
nr:MAG TPA: hypothetical protein [Caudoviricetes sp.]